MFSFGCERVRKRMKVCKKRKNERKRQKITRKRKIEHIFKRNDYREIGRKGERKKQRDKNREEKTETWEER